MTAPLNAMALLKAAWAVARQFWPRKVVEFYECPACRQPKTLRMLETAIRVEEPMPGFKEAIEAALAAAPRPDPPDGGEPTEAETR